jgi:glutamate decarboxylase
MLGTLFHVPVSSPGLTPTGTSTVGSSEAAALAFLSQKYKWRARRVAAGLTFDNPNMVMPASAHTALKRFAKYFDCELRLLEVKPPAFVFDPSQLFELVDENTIGVTAILGSTYNGQFDDIKGANDVLMEIQRTKGWDVPLHVDAASGGFVAPFLFPDLEWDFRLPRVKSINVSGHKYGLVYASIGWLLFRSKEDLPRDLVYEVDYLAGTSPSIGINFSQSSHNVFLQLYQLLRLGKEGYTAVMLGLQQSASSLTDKLKALDRFDIHCDNTDPKVPVVVFSIREGSDVTAAALTKQLRNLGWTLPQYPMPGKVERPIVMRAVMRLGFGELEVRELVRDIQKSLWECDAALADRAT